MAGNRQRLRPWLIAKINSGCIKGLHWLNKEERIFRIPWKHGGKQDWSPEHSEVFKEWAIHTGKHRVGLDPLEWAKWKTRLRCAFNKAPDIIELKEQSEPDAANPFKVYQFKDLDKIKKIPAVAPKKQTTTHHATPISTEPMLPLYVEGAQVSRSGDLPSDLQNIPSMELVKGDPGELSVNMMSAGSLSSFGEVKMESMETNEPVAIDPSPFPTNEATGAPLMPHPSSSPLLGATPTTPSPYSQPPSASSASSDTTFDLPSPAASDVSGVSTLYSYQPQSSPLQGDVPGLMPYPMTPVEVVYCGQDSIELTDTFTELTAYQELPSHTTNPAGTMLLQLMEGEDGTQQLVFKEEMELPAQLQGHEMSVRVQYLQQAVLEELIVQDTGCRLHYGSDSDIRSVYNDEQALKILGPNEASPLHLPPCDGILQGKAEEYTQMLLPNIARGVFIECVNGDIWATRFCKCIIYYCNEDQPQGTKLERHQRTKIFDFTNMFLPKYQRCQMGEVGVAPSPEVCLSFGQKSYYATVSQTTLISAYILSIKAHRLVENFGQTSPTSVDPEGMQISEPDEQDHQLEFFNLAGTI